MHWPLRQNSGAQQSASWVQAPHTVPLQAWPPQSRHEAQDDVAPVAGVQSSSACKMAMSWWMVTAPLGLNERTNTAP